MASDRQVEANRQNAQSSTGPKTDEGKEKSSMNAVKHGLLSKRVVLPGENVEEFKEYRNEMIGALNPVGALECLLADRIIVCGWRLGRIITVESGFLSGGSSLDLGSFRRFGNNEAELFSDRRDSTLNLARYEASIEKSFFKSFLELRRLQSERLGA